MKRGGNDNHPKKGEKKEAHVFTTLCGFGCWIGEFVPLILNVKHPVYNDQGIHFNSLSHLDSIELVKFNGVMSISRTGLPKVVTIQYYDVPLKLEFPNPEGNSLDIGFVRLSDSGQQLSKICSARPVDGFLDYVINQWASKSFVLSSPYPWKI